MFMNMKESRQLGLLWKSLHGAPLLRQILNDQEPQPMFAASFQANFHVKFWDLVRHLEDVNGTSTDHSATTSQVEVEDDLPVEVEILHSDADIFYA